MHKGKNLRRVRAPEDLWLQLDQAVATAGDGDRSTVTRRLWRLYIDQPSVRQAVAAMADHGDVATPDATGVATDTTPATAPVATDISDVDRLKQRVATLRSYGYNIGLSPADVQDTVKVWLNWYAIQDVPCDFTHIEMALRARAAGQEWRPQP